MKNKSWSLEDAQKVAENFPYTFYKPSSEVISQLQPGNQAKLIFTFASSDPESPNAERMWVEITQVTADGYIGYLDNDPVHITDLKHKDVLEFQTCHIIDIDLDDPVPSIVERYIKKCFVTNNVLYEGRPVGYLYREAPNDEEDSGWRFTAGDETDDYMENAENLSYVSLGAVLREDDSFITLLEKGEGVAFFKDDNGNFAELD